MSCYDEIEIHLCLQGSISFSDLVKRMIFKFVDIVFFDFNIGCMVVSSFENLERKGRELQDLQRDLL